MKTLLFFVISVFFFPAFQCFSQTAYEANWESIDSRPIPGWFEDAKFGIFIHWGVYSVPAFSPTVRDSVGVHDRYAEHYWRRLTEPGKTQHYFQKFHNQTYGPNFTYQDFAGNFSACLFDPNEWAGIFEGSGAKYVVLTSKHHDGFTLWKSEYSWNWNSVDVGPHRDLLGDLTKAVKDKGLRMGYYYSLLEWYHPFYKKTSIGKYVDGHMIPQMKELVYKYKPDIIWTDGEWDYPSDILKSTHFLQWLYNDSPVKEDVVVNDRWGNETRSKHGGFYTTEYDLVKGGKEKEGEFSHPWEECRGIGGSFGYNRNEILGDYSGSEELVHILINKVARGGNLLLNIGPTADGRIPVIMQQRLYDIGKWLKVNGEAIFDTRKWPGAPGITPLSSVFYTLKGNDLFVIVTKWQDEPIIIEGVGTPENITMLGFSDEIEYSVRGQELHITPPALSPANNPCQFAWVFKLENVHKKT